jgi:hypothetical protein
LHAVGFIEAFHEVRERRGTGNPNYATVVRLAGALGLTPGELVTRADRVRASAPD